jgi:BolA family transcriptional regulator, general stress-responsive regulator
MNQEGSTTPGSARTVPDEIINRLHATFSPQLCQLEDESALHAGHAGAASGGGHYRLKLISTAFEGRNRVARHRLVYDCLLDMMHRDIHALAIVALAPSEVED